MSMFKFFLSFSLVFCLSGCGQTGTLYLPKNSDQKPHVSVGVSAGAITS